MTKKLFRTAEIYLCDAITMKYSKVLDFCNIFFFIIHDQRINRKIYVNPFIFGTTIILKFRLATKLNLIKKKKTMKLYFKREIEIIRGRYLLKLDVNQEHI